MKNVAAVLLLLASAWAGAALADQETEPPGYSAPGCDVGLSGDNAAGTDADRDGVPDSEDWCGHSPRGWRVGPNGCARGEIAEECGPRAMASPDEPAAVVPAVAPVKPAEREESPAPAKPADTDDDDDGVENEDDECPGTPRGSDVDSDGCVEIEKVVLKGVNFATGSATLKREAHAILRSVATAMKANDDLEVEIQGYTDAVGPEDKNQVLSEKRAEAVKAFLMSEGIDEDRLTTEGFGESEPVDSNDTAAGRANNRRVSFKITDD